MASKSVDFPEPEAPTKRKPLRAIGTSWYPVKVPQLRI